MDGNEHHEEGVYLICDGGYLRWPTLICPFKKTDKTSKHGYFTTNLESVRKDVECTFGILKKRWRILDYGLKYRKMADCEKVFTVCCVLNNMMLDEMDRDTSTRVSYSGRNNNNDSDTMFIEERPHLEPPEPRVWSDVALALSWGRRREILAEHLHYMARRAKRARREQQRTGEV
jgi:hypothetical protein